ncbi:MAG: hypothetical protein F9K44_13765 [Hyphomicrobiaceae bacterium]|nr:MAG: hypothetical protein F9K44_13765 [Hyphomicrobiaceae bacterium]
MRRVISVSGAGFAIAAIIAAASIAMADGGSSEGTVVAASDCPVAEAILSDAGISVDTFAPECPTTGEAEEIVSQHESQTSVAGTMRANTLDHLKALLERAQSGELQIPGFSDGELVSALQAAVSLVDDSSVTSQEAKELDSGTTNAVLDALRDSGDFPEDPTRPISGDWID